MAHPKVFGGGGGINKRVEEVTTNGIKTIHGNELQTMEIHLTNQAKNFPTYAVGERPKHLTTK